MLAEARFVPAYAGNVFQGKRPCRVIPLNSGWAAMHIGIES